MITALAFALILQTQNLGPAANKTLVWSDDFQGNGLPNENEWADGIECPRTRPHQIYTDMVQKNVQREDGRLVITALKQGDDYTTAALETKKSWLYGYFEVRAKIPTGRGPNPAIWFLGQSLRDKAPDHVKWPNCGEMDLMENVGYAPDRIYFHIHTANEDDTRATSYGNAVVTPEASSEFHVYGLDWTPTKIDMYFDGQKVLTYTKHPKNPNSWPFDKPQFLIINLSIGGKKGVDPSIFPVKFQIDYVHIYQ